MGARCSDLTWTKNQKDIYEWKHLLRVCVEIYPKNQCIIFVRVTVARYSRLQQNKKHPYEKCQIHMPCKTLKISRCFCSIVMLIPLLLEFGMLMGVTDAFRLDFHRMAVPPNGLPVSNFFSSIPEVP